MRKEIEDLFNKLEEEKKSWRLTQEDMDSFNSSWALSISSRNDNLQFESANQTWKEYEANTLKTANKVADIAYDQADKKLWIEEAASNEKIARSDETRKELLETTGDFKNKQDTRYQEVADITKRQENIANREANIAVAKAWKYWDVFTDNQRNTIKNDVINKYGQNILSAEQYELNTNRTIDNDLLNVWLKELEDKNNRDVFKDALLDKENSYILTAIDKAATGNTDAVKDVQTFYNSMVKQKADEETTRWLISEKVQSREKEYADYDPTTKIAFVKDLTKNFEWIGYVWDSIWEMINKYPQASLEDIVSKITKEAQYAKDQSIMNNTLAQKSAEDRTATEENSFNTAIDRWQDARYRWDPNTTVSDQQQKNALIDQTTKVTWAMEDKLGKNIPTDNTNKANIANEVKAKNSIRDDISKVKNWEGKIEVTKDAFLKMTADLMGWFKKAVTESWRMTGDEYDAKARVFIKQLQNVYTIK